jgi:hypothetical protein
MLVRLLRIVILSPAGAEEFFVSQSFTEGKLEIAVYGSRRIRLG